MRRTLCLFVVAALCLAQTPVALRQGIIPNATIQANGVVVGSQPNFVLNFGSGLVASCVNSVATKTIICTPSANTAIVESLAVAQSGKPLYCKSINGTSAYTCTLNAAAALTTYTEGMVLLFRPDVTNLSTPPTINVDGVGLAPLLQRNGSVPTSNQIAPNQAIWIWYDGAAFRLMY